MYFCIVFQLGKTLRNSRWRVLHYKGKLLAKLVHIIEKYNKGTTEDEMAGWHHQHNGRGFGYPPGVGDGQGGLVSCS